MIFSLSMIFSKEYSAEESKKLRAAVCAQAKSYIGCPYRTGATGPDSFDCSGLVYTVFREAAGIQLPRSAKAIYSAVKIVSSSQLETGDLVFFKTTGDGTISHVGIYIGRNQFIHAASDGSNTGVIASSLTEKYYKNTFAAVGKVITTPAAEKESTATTQEEQKKMQTALHQNLRLHHLHSSLRHKHRIPRSFQIFQLTQLCHATGTSGCQTNS